MAKWGDLVAQWGCGGSAGMWWLCWREKLLSKDVMTPLGCGVTVGM
jgi:hypothetical protein